MDARRPGWCRWAAAMLLALLAGAASSATPDAFAQNQGASAEPRNVELVGHVGGSISVIEIRGGYAYVGQAGRLVILDVSEPAHPRLVGKSAPIGHEVRQITLVGDYAYLAVSADLDLKNGGIRVLRIADPANPLDVGFYPITENRFPTLVLVGSHGYVTAGTIPRGWDLVDFSDPASPKEVARSTMPYGLAVGAGQYVYVYGARPPGLQVFDVSDPAHPNLVGSLDHAAPGKTLSILGSTLYLMSDNKQLQTIDVSDPTKPRIAAEGNYGRMAAAHVAVAGDRAYLVGVENRAPRLLDISDPLNPVELGTSGSWEGAIQQAAVDGNMVYVAVASAGLRVVAIDSSKRLAEVGAFDGPGNPVGTTSIALSGGQVYIADRENGVHVVRVDDPANPVAEAAYRDGGEAVRVAVNGAFAYVLERSASTDRPVLRILDVSDSSRPVAVGTLARPGLSEDLVVDGSYAYLVLSGKLHVIDVSDPTRPTEVGVYAPPSDPSMQGNFLSGRIAVAGSRVYLASSSLQPPTRGLATPKPVLAGSGLRVVDVSNPAAPVGVGFTRLAWEPDAVAVVGNHVYVVAHQLEGDPSSGLRVFDVSNPTHPLEVASLPTGARLSASSIAVAGEYAYVVGNGLHVLNISDPGRPVEEGYFPGGAQSGAVSGNLAYLGMGSDGLSIVRFTGGVP